MSTTTLSSALRSQIRGTASNANLSQTQRAALRTWARRQARAKVQGSKAVGAPSGLLIWL